MTRTPIRVASLVLLLSTSLARTAAADLKIEITSAGAPGNGSVKILGDPGLTYQLWASSVEEPSTIDPGVELLIDPLRQFATMLFIGGTLGDTGTATYEFPIGADWTGNVLSFQAVVLDPETQVSNLCRATFQTNNSFVSTVGLPLGLSLLGDLFPTPDGKLLAIGGAGPLAAVYEPCLQELVLTPGAITPASPLATRTMLNDGTVLLAGGIGTDGQPTKEAYIYDPISGATLATKTGLAVARAGASAVKLANGRVFIVGGFSTINLADLVGTLEGVLRSGETYNPTTGGFTTGTPSDLPLMLEPKALATATLLDNGTVLVAGGLGVTPVVPLPYVSFTGVVYDPVANAFGVPKIFSAGRLFHSATKPPNGQVMLAGGFTADMSTFITSGDPNDIAFEAVTSSSLYSTAGSGSFASGPALVTSRALHTATLMGNGKVLIAGGVTGQLDITAILSGNFVFPSPIDSSELVTSASSVAGPTMTSARAGASAAVSPMDGRVLLVGGGSLQPELYQP